MVVGTFGREGDRGPGDEDEHARLREPADDGRQREHGETPSLFREEGLQRLPDRGGAGTRLASPPPSAVSSGATDEDGPAGPSPGPGESATRRPSRGRPRRRSRRSCPRWESREGSSHPLHAPVQRRCGLVRGGHVRGGRELAGGHTTTDPNWPPLVRGRFRISRRTGRNRVAVTSTASLAVRITARIRATEAHRARRMTEGARPTSSTS